ncbi:hypothetical protein K491DRAFT_718150 [Lophiostoma macrostomum CBS 122681]|uniref:Zn(2)-C6 fungal-type domain-containing protein n=1 Tax=Lophiostoma macrostomum CBS 122681 TaxID=1314788 RepID=A0A6A6T0L4_9PLEO|nr:hypothetical protein K491DRAFT_718150 [Lophiostoma macrostomum CBS 122681]
MAPPSAASRFREAYGDRKPPDITRRITACVACRKLKIRCHMTNSKPPCSRCKGRGLPCTVNKSIQMILEDDLTWKESMEQRIITLEKQLEANGSPHSNHKGMQKSPQTEELLWDFNLPPIASPDPPSLLMAPETGISTPDRALNLSCSLGAFPASSMTCCPIDDTGKTLDTKPDVITRGVISEAAAQQLFNFYHEALDKHIYNILDSADDKNETWRRSSLLTSAICTVAAFVSASPQYDSCLKAFTDEAAAQVFSKEHTFDEIRALCIGSFWLSEISAALCSLAVRFASELNLHRCITKMPHSDPKCYERTQLYFLVVVCDHHCSLKHGRPPMTRTLRSLKHPRILLRSQHSRISDRRLIADLELCSLNTAVFDTFGADVATPFDPARTIEIQQLGSYFDDWCEQWSDVLRLNGESDHFATVAFNLYYHSAKLCLFSLVFRGSSHKPLTATDTLAEMIRRAVEEAKHIISYLTAIRNEISKWPSYIVTMAAFASVFLLGASSHSPSDHTIDRAEAIKSLQVLLDIVNESHGVLHSSHSLLVIKNGLSTALDAQSSASRAYSTISECQDYSSYLDLQSLPQNHAGPTCAQSIDWITFSNNYHDGFSDLWTRSLGDFV